MALNAENNRIVITTASAQRIAALLIHRSCWFAVTPLPDDAYCFEFKRGEGIRDAIDADLLAKGSSSPQTAR